MTRWQWFNEQVDYSCILRKTETRDFLEVVVDRYGDILCYRVYGDEKSGFSLGVK